MSRTVKKPYHHGDLREKLVTAGEQALQDLPLAEVTLREIARRAGVSHAAPKHHFASLGELLAEIAARGFRRFVAELDAAMAASSEQSTTGRLHAMGRAYLDFAVGQPAVYGLMFGQQGDSVMTPALMEAMKAAWSQLSVAVEAVTGPARARDGAITLWASVHGLAMLALERRMPPVITIGEATEAVLRLTIAGLKAGDGALTAR